MARISPAAPSAEERGGAASQPLELRFPVETLPRSVREAAIEHSDNVDADPDEPGSEGADAWARGGAADALVLTPAQRVAGRGARGGLPPLVLRGSLARPRAAPAPAPAPDDGALRALVAEAVRAELGAAVERALAGTMRELVRHEVRRVLVEQGERSEPRAER